MAVGEMPVEVKGLERQARQLSDEVLLFVCSDQIGLISETFGA